MSEEYEYADDAYEYIEKLERELQEAKDLLNEWQWLFQHLNPALSEKTDNFCEKRSDEL